MQEFSYRNNSLHSEDLPLSELAKRFGTPLYVYSRRSVVDHCRHIEGAFSGEEHRSSYAVKANSNVELLRIIASAGMAADVGSRGELYLALKGGFLPSAITYSGVGKRDDEMRYALENDIAAFNVESAEEIAVLGEIASSMGTVARILLRVNLDIDAGGHAYISTSLKRTKFGVDWHKAGELLRRAQKTPGIEVRGIHSHIGSQIIKADTFLRAAQMLVGLVRELRESGITMRELDFGGGFGVQYRGYVSHAQLPPEEPEETNLSAATLVKTVLPVLRGSGCRLGIQPGRSIIAHAGALLTRVIFRKVTDEKVFVIVDTGMNDLIRPSLYHAYHQIVPTELHGASPETVDIVGPLCESGDFLAQDRPLPRVERNELLAVMCAGAYGYVLSSNYNARTRPAEVLVDGSAATVIRERETVEDL
jgi:diaminopimelate decarboxylase